MDILELIKKQVEQALLIDESIMGLESVVTHIERAEYLMDLANTEDDIHFFTDVIYRTNHAYEGILKEAYICLTGKSSKNVTPYQIEDHLLNNDILKDRVIELLKNYRTNWRNTSTHDYNLFFDSSEALLAISSVSAFVYILLQQILGNLYLIKQQKNFENLNQILKSELTGNYNTLSIDDKVIAILKIYKGYKGISTKEGNSIIDSFREVLYQVGAFISSVDDTLTVQIEPEVSMKERHFSPDMIVIDSNGDKVVIELKIFNKIRRTRAFEAQVLAYITYTGAVSGIVLQIPQNLDEELDLKEYSSVLETNNGKYKIYNVYHQSK